MSWESGRINVQKVQNSRNSDSNKTRSTHKEHTSARLQKIWNEAIVNK